MPPKTHEQQGQTEETGEKLSHQIHVGVCLNSSTDLAETTRRVRLMTNVEKADLYMEESFQNATSQEFADLMDAIGSLPKLLSLRILSSSFGGRFVQIPFATLEGVLESAKCTLRHLNLSHVDFTFPEDVEGVNTCPLMALIKLLEHNNTLKELCINYGGYRKISRSTQHALLSMLQYKNYSLEGLVFDVRTTRQFSASKRKKIKFYLSLNQEGLRDKLLGPNANATSKQWEEAIIANRCQSSTVYYLLSNNPTTICA